MTSANFSAIARIGKRSIYLALLALVLVLSGIGVLSLTTSWRDAAYLYFAHASSYKRYNEELHFTVKWKRSRMNQSAYAMFVAVFSSEDC